MEPTAGRHATSQNISIRVLLAILLVSLAFSAQAEEVRVLTFNTWFGGSAISDGQAKVVDAIETSGADIVLLQEANLGVGSFVASELGWYSYVTGDDDVISRYPIIYTAQTTQGVIAEIELPNGSIVAAVSVHLSSSPYGPYAACLDEDSEAEVLATEDWRLDEITEIIASLDFYLETDTPILMGGDFNAPSHLDWTVANSDLHCGYAIEWPVSLAVDNAGFTDAYRASYPDARTHPANTWSPIYTDYVYGDGKPEPLDRIDFIYFSGSAVTLTSASEFVVGVPAQSPNHTNNEWPSDHASVRATFDIPAGVGSSAQEGDVELSTEQPIYPVGEPIVINFSGGPGNSLDWVGIYPVGGNTPGNGASTAWLYVNESWISGASGITEGTLNFDSGSTWSWPLAEGNYHAFFLEDYGYNILAGPVPFTVSNTTPTLSVSQSSFGAGEDIELSFAGGTGNLSDWVVIYPSGGGSPGNGDPTTWLYVGGSESPTDPVSEGTLTFTSPGTGEWDAYFLATGGSQILAGPISFEVTELVVEVPSLRWSALLTLLVAILAFGFHYLISRSRDPSDKTLLVRDDI